MTPSNAILTRYTALIMYTLTWRMMYLSEDEVNDTDADVDVAEDGVVGTQ